jgi:hydroxymethylpyrimidine kinase / phosphomethylpyrimidine kinase / thiamine-phosphate diphosphorylase
MNNKIALTIAGSDSCSGAGIQADIKSFSRIGVYGLSVITCVTSQNTMNVKNIFPLPKPVIESQIDCLFEDFNIDAVKTGMLYDEKIIKLVSKKIKKNTLKPVVDPVMVATSGDFLALDTYLSAFKKHLLPLTFILTANISEASFLSNTDIKSIDDVKKSAKKLYDLGPKNVLIKGGHLQTQQSTDVFYDGKNYFELSLPRIENKKAHGSGCSLSAVITALLALGESPFDAVEKAKHSIWSMIYKGYKPAKGSDVLNHSYMHSLPLHLTAEKITVWGELENQIENLLLILPSTMIPEVGMNFAYACEKAKTPQHICAIDGRIGKTKDKSVCLGSLNFDISKHVASIILASMYFDETMRCALNIKYSKKNLEKCEKARLRIGFFDRKNEPSNTQSTMEWGTKNAIQTLGFIPDVIYDLGGIGKEPMIRILGKNPKDVLLKLQKIIQTEKR